ncbi:hypothetical protein BDN67DRAFT_975036, partial [Paxillus ammoniavirescens]
LGASSNHERCRTATQHLSTCRTHPGSCPTRSVLVSAFFLFFLKCSLGPCRLRLVSLGLPLSIPSKTPKHPLVPPYPSYHPPDLSVPICASKTAFINCPNCISLLRCNRGG